MKTVRNSGERGSVLLTIVVLLSVIAGVATALMTVTTETSNASLDVQNRLLAKLAAEAGIEHARGKLLAGAEDGWTNELTDGLSLEKIPFGEATYTVTLTDNDDGDGDLLADTDYVLQASAVANITAARGGGSNTVSRAVSTVFHWKPASTTITVVPVGAIVAGGDLKINGNPTIAGTGGSVHTNADLLITGSPSITGSATAAGNLTITGTPTIGGTAAGGEPEVPIPDVVPADWKSFTLYTLTATGTVVDNATGIVISNPGATGVAWNGWKLLTASPVVWEYKSTTTYDNAVYVEGSAAISGSPGQKTVGNKTYDPWEITIVAEVDINVTGDPTLVPYDDTQPEKLAFVAGRDMKIMGNAGAEPGYDGLFLINEDLTFQGNPGVMGSFMVTGNPDTSGSLVSPGDGLNVTVGGNPTLTYNGDLTYEATTVDPAGSYVESYMTVSKDVPQE